MIAGRHFLVCLQRRKLLVDFANLLFYRNRELKKEMCLMAVTKEIYHRFMLIQTTHASKTFKQYRTVLTFCEPRDLIL